MPSRFSRGLPPQVSTSRTTPPQVGGSSEGEPTSAPVGVPDEQKAAIAEVEQARLDGTLASTETPEQVETPEADAEADTSTDVEGGLSDEELAEMREVYDSMNMDELKEEAKGRNLSGYSQLNKADLIDLILEDDVAPKGDVE